MLLTRIAASISGLLSKGFTTGNTAGIPFKSSGSFELGDGTGLGNADRMFQDRRTLAASATEDLDLAGVLVNSLGEATTFARVKAVLIRHISGVNNVVVGNAAATQFVGWFGAATHTIVIPPTGMALIARNDAGGWVVGAGTTDFLRIANGAGATPVTYEITIIGTSV